jgi:transposase-like protein
MKKLICSHCKSKEVVKRGTFETKAHGKQQMLYCKSCGKRCIERTPFYRMRNESQKITCALDLFYRGVSTRKIQEHFQAFYPHNSSHKSIYKWVVKYAKIISNFTDNLKVNVGSEIQVDEMEYSRRKQRNRKGIDRNWFIDSIDTKTRFMVASKYVKARENKQIKNILNNLKKKSKNQIKVITTDGHVIYQNVVKKVFGYNNKLGKYNIVHNVVNASAGEGFNIMIERLHNNIRQRTKTFRGFHGSIESANSIMKGLEVYYNFITEHQGIECCPYELAIPELKSKLNVPNRWLALIQLSQQNL